MACKAQGVNPADRVTFVVATAKAVLDDRLDVADGATAVQMQAEQLIPLLRTDRDSVTRSECESVATTLRLLAEQVNDLGRRSRLDAQIDGLVDGQVNGQVNRQIDDERDGADPHQAMARAIGEMAQALR
jgi:predicted naringenin-chalcone synthase